MPDARVRGAPWRQAKIVYHILQKNQVVLEILSNVNNFISFFAAWYIASQKKPLSISSF
jgi:hypothetical protein